MKKIWKKSLISILLMLALLVGCAAPTTDVGTEEKQENINVIEQEEQVTIAEEGEYTTKEDVGLYLYTYGHLPSNFITKKEAKELGWVSKEGNLAEVAPGKSIGGDYFGNYEGILPEEYDYRECDIDSNGDYRGAKRIVFSEECELIYYTEDHYESFELLYGEE